MTIEKVLATAAAELGYREGANNDSKYGAEYGLNNQPWCVMFLWWVFKHSGAAALFPNTAHCDGVRSYAQSIGRWYNHADIGEGIDLQPGDIIIFDYAPADGSGDHIALIENVANNNRYTTLEGNYADSVARVNRTLEDVSGIYRPDYDSSAAAEEPEEETPEEDDGSLKYGDCEIAVAIMQYALHVHGYTPSGSRLTSGDWDGEWGDGTQAALDAFTGEKNSRCTAEVWRRLLK